MQQSVTMEAPWTSPPPRRVYPAPTPPLADRCRAALGGRLAGPGDYYNIGNALGLLGGVALAVVAAEAPSLRTGARAALDHLAGSASALSVTLAMLIFFVSGEAYHRAWAGGFPPDKALNRRGDVLSGYGALALGLGLFLLGQPVLAATAGLMHAFGKFGSALHRPDPAARASHWPDPFRTAVLLSRVPAIVLVLAAIAVALAAPGGPHPMAIAAPGLLLVCYLLWARADLLLFRG
jgi:hypothetical protein